MPAWIWREAPFNEQTKVTDSSGFAIGAGSAAAEADQDLFPLPHCAVRRARQQQGYDG